MQWIVGELVPIGDGGVELAGVSDEGESGGRLRR
jgi:hypothetical protein